MSKIDKNIPIPTENRGRKLKHKYDKMEVGDSIFSKSYTLTAAKLWAKRSGLKWDFTGSYIDNGYRLWRVK